jgi:hypothetical protein
MLAGADRFAHKGHVVADGRFDHGFFRGYSPFEAGAGRVASPDSELVLRGLWSDAPIELTATLASGLPRAQLVSVYANGVRVAARDVGGRFGTLPFEARADRAGVLRLRFVGDGSPSSAVRVARVDVLRTGAGAVPLRRWLMYAGLVLLLVAAVDCGQPGSASRIGLYLALASALLLGLRIERLAFLEHLPLLLTALALGLGAFLFSRGLGMVPDASAWVAASFGLRSLLGLHPAFPAVDLSFHVHNVLRLLAGLPVASHVSNPSGAGLLSIPYPPLLYVLVQPFGASEASAEAALRMTMVVLECSAPWLVLAILTAAGASPRAGSAAAVTLAVMPEGLLVLAKGIAANVLGSWLGLAVVWAVAAPASLPLLALLLAAALLAHPGAAATMLCLVLLVLVGQARSGGLPRARASGLAGAGLAAAAIAWLAYYREMAAVTAGSLGSLASHMREAPGAFFAFRGVHLLKIAQNLLLKMGGGPLILAVSGWRGEAGSRGRLLVRAWLLVGAAFAVLAVMTPLAFRFEYFLAPAVAILAGLGAERWQAAGKGRWVTAVWAASFALQMAIGLALFLGRFELISVIIPSPRWAWPLRPW